LLLLVLLLKLLILFLMPFIDFVSYVRFSFPKVRSLRVFPFFTFNSFLGLLFRFVEAVLGGQVVRGVLVLLTAVARVWRLPLCMFLFETEKEQSVDLVDCVSVPVVVVAAV
jgi:hypothetical protein